MKYYLGIRSSEDCHVYVANETGAKKPLHHLVVHSPTGFEWGYHGSGPADLALSILGDYFGEQPTKKELHQGHFELPRELENEPDFRKWDKVIEEKKLKCCNFYQSFKSSFVGGFSKEGFTLSESTIKSWVNQQIRNAKAKA